MQTLRLVAPPPSPSWSAFVQRVLAGERGRALFRDGWTALSEGFARASTAHAFPEAQEILALLSEKQRHALIKARQVLAPPASRAAERAIRYVVAFGHKWLRSLEESGIELQSLAETVTALDNVMTVPVASDVVIAELLTFALLDLLAGDVVHRATNDVAFDASSAWAKVDMVFRSAGVHLDPWQGETAEERGQRAADEASELEEIEWTGIDETFRAARWERLR